MYRVLHNRFDSFEEAVQWVWNNYKIDFYDDLYELDDLTEKQKLEACEDIEDYLVSLEIA